MRLNLHRAAVVMFSAASLFYLAGCLTVDSQAKGLLYTDTKGPVAATSARATQATKTGTACEQSILGLVATGDASIATAESSAGISEIVAVDQTANSILGIIATYCVSVRGN